MAGKLEQMQGRLQQAVAAVDDIAKKLEAVTRQFQEADLSKVLNINKASADMQQFLAATTGATTALQKQHRVERELDKALVDHEKRFTKLALENKKLYANKSKWSKFERDQFDKNKKDMKHEYDTLQKIHKLKTPQSLQKLTNEYDALEKSTKMTTLTTQLFVKGLELLLWTGKQVYEWQERLTRNLSTLAERFGGATDSILGMATVARDEFLNKNGLGGMGFELEEITQKLADFREQLQFTGRVSQQESLQLVKYGMTIGMNASQVGELSRAIVLMGGGAKDVTRFMAQVTIASRRSGVTAAALAKQFQGAGKALFELTGPRARQQLMESAGFLAKMGTGLDKLQGFIQMSDTFDQAAESMAKLNTAFGTGLNAMEVFAEQDPAKRMAMVVKRFQLQGMTVDMMRQEKRLLMDSLKIDEQTANAVLNAAEGRQDINKALEEQVQKEQDIAKTNAEFDDMLQRGKKTLIAWSLAWSKFIDKIEASGMIKALKGAFEGIMWLVDSPVMSTFATGLSDTFSMIADMIEIIVKGAAIALMPMVWAAGKVLSAVAQIWKLLKYVIAGVSAVAGALSGGKGWSSFGEFDTTDEATEMKRGWANLLGQDEIGGVKNTVGQKTSATPSVPTPIEGFADGGDFRKNQMMVVGERGAELAVSGPAGTIINNETLQQVAAAAQTGTGQPIIVQVILDGEVIQESMYKSDLRRHA